MFGTASTTEAPARCDGRELDYILPTAGVHAGFGAAALGELTQGDVLGGGAAAVRVEADLVKFGAVVCNVRYAPFIYRS
jgi:hypothetical protein